MKSLVVQDGPLSLKQVESALQGWLAQVGRPLRRVLLIPPDGTRAHSFAGPITALLYRLLQPAEVKVLPALGTHVPMTREEKQRMFGHEIPAAAYIDHHWRTDVTRVGVIPGEFVAEVSGGLVDYPIAVDINRELVEGGYDLILSIGQVVPHEVVGMANYTKNVVVGCGGKEIIDKSHFLGAVYGMEKLMGRDHSPVRKVFDYAEQHFLSKLPLAYILTVTKTERQHTSLMGLFMGRERHVFEQAVALSQKHNLDLLAEPLHKVVVYLDPTEFKSTWLGNKAVYRTRMAIADGGELVILAPGVRMFGEDPEIDRLIRAFGYQKRLDVLRAARENQELAANLSVAAHLIHGSSDGRFKITYAVQHLTEEEVRGVHFHYLPYEQAVQRYNPAELQDGFNVVGEEKVFFISNPALGLWALEKDFN
ncbi:MAG TPA: lactate racemase domain-containing protein [Limnochordia bacterium]|jgi:nickel-dependent lactate racemase|nr:lactate racemase domain-containing protein [Limnochordia bacterium]